MITLKLKYTSENKDNILQYLKECNKLVRISYNLIKSGKSPNLVCKIIKSDYNYNKDLIDYSILNYCVQESYNIHQSGPKDRKTLIFGSKALWNKFCNKKITKEEFNYKKNTLPVRFIGRMDDPRGNRKFKIDVVNSCIIFQPKRNVKIVFSFTTGKNILNKLKTISEMGKLHEMPITFSFTPYFINVIFDEKYLSKQNCPIIKNRIASIDMNPNYIGVIIKDYSNDKIIFKEIINLKTLNNCNNNNKICYEVNEICKYISEKCKHYKTEIFAYEGLKNLKKNKNKGKNLNRLCNNLWKRGRLVKRLIKNLNIIGIKHTSINAAYSTTVGCLINKDDTDSIASAIEIGRRCYASNNFRSEMDDRDNKNEDVMFPKVDYNQIKERWNSILFDYNWQNFGFVDIHKFLKSKNKLIKLRFFYDDWIKTNPHFLFRHKSPKSKVLGCLC